MLYRRLKYKQKLDRVRKIVFCYYIFTDKSNQCHRCKHINMHYTNNFYFILAYRFALHHCLRSFCTNNTYLNNDYLFYIYIQLHAPQRMEILVVNIEHSGRYDRSNTGVQEFYRVNC